MAEGWDNWGFFTSSYDQALAQAIDWSTSHEQPKGYEDIAMLVAKMRKNPNPLGSAMAIFSLVGLLHTLNTLKERNDEESR